MDTAALSVLQGIRLTPVPTCSCAKGLAVGLRVVTSCLPALTAVIKGQIPGPQQISLTSNSTDHPELRQYSMALGGTSSPSSLKGTQAGVTESGSSITASSRSSLINSADVHSVAASYGSHTASAALPEPEDVGFVRSCTSLYLSRMAAGL